MTLSTLPDAVAIRILSTVAGPLLRTSPAAASSDPDIVAALADTFGPVPDAPAPTQADLARAALALAAEDAPTHAAIEALAEGADPGRFAVGETIALVTTVTAALALLQTELTFERTTAGKWKVKLHKRPASDALLKALAQTIMRALGGGEGKGASRLPK